MKQWLIYLYPRTWRARYGDEFCAVLDQQRLTIADVIDIIRGAFDAHWTTVLAASKDPTTLPRLLSQVMPLVWLAIIVGLFLVPSVGAFWPAARWYVVARPPLPTHAMHIQTEYPPRFTGSDDVNRTTTFTTDQPPAVIQQFYRTTLPSQGWHYLCTVTPTEPPCGYLSLWPDAEELIEVYEPDLRVKHARAVEITIVRPDARGMRTVQIYEVLVDRSNRMPRSTDPTGPPPVALVGQWRGTDSATGKHFILRFYQDNRVEVVSGNWERGDYRWEGDTALRMTFTGAARLRVVGEADDGAYGLCRHAPTLLKEQCQVTDPSSYPGPPPTSTPTPTPVATVTPDPAYPGPPTPTPQPLEAVSSRIDATFAVVVDGDTLTLTNPSGMTQTFQRVGGP